MAAMKKDFIVDVGITRREKDFDMELGTRIKADMGSSRNDFQYTDWDENEERNFTRAELKTKILPFSKVYIDFDISPVIGDENIMRRVESGSTLGELLDILAEYYVYLNWRDSEVDEPYSHPYFIGFLPKLNEDGSPMKKKAFMFIFQRMVVKFYLKKCSI